MTNTKLAPSIRRAILRSANQKQANIRIEVIPGMAVNVDEQRETVPTIHAVE